MQSRRREKTQQHVDNQLRDGYGLYNFVEEEPSKNRRKDFSAGFKDVTKTQFSTGREFKKHAERELRSLLKQYTKKNATEKMVPLDMDKLERTEMFLYLSSYLEPGKLGKMISFYNEGKKRIDRKSKMMKLAMLKVSKKKEEKGETSIVLKANKNIGVTVVSCGWLEKELRRQLELGSYEEVVKSDEEIVKELVAKEEKLKASFTEGEKKVFERYYRSGDAKGRRLGLLRIQVNEKRKWQLM